MDAFKIAQERLVELVNDRDAATVARILAELRHAVHFELTRPPASTCRCCGEPTEKPLAN